MHILTLKDVIDAQAAGDQAKVYSLLREAYGHMGMIANPIAAAISQQFPDKFGGVVAPVAPAPAANAPAAAPQVMPETGGETSMLEPAYVITIVAIGVIVAGAWLMRLRTRRSA